MDRERIADPSGSVAGVDRVLLLVDNQRDRSLLEAQLPEKTVVEADPDEPLPVFDICIVDTKRYPHVEDELVRRRADTGDVPLPVLLVLGPGEREAAARRLATGVDDVLAVPSSEAVFQSRVESLLQTRRQAKQLELYQRAMDDATTGITIARADGDQELTYVNDAFVEITGYSRDEAIGRNCRFLQGPKTAAEPVERMWSAIQAREPVVVELRNYRKNGTIFWNRVEIAPISGPDGVTHFVGIQEDITDRVQRSRDLQHYEHIVRAATDPIYSLDGDLRVTLANEATVELCDRTQSALRGEHVTSVFGDEYASKLADAILSLIKNCQTQTVIETSVTDADGQSRQYQTAVGIIPGEQFEGVVCVSRDITDDREREYRLSVLDRVLRHNLRNKLHVVLAQVEFIRENASKSHMGVHAPADKIESTAQELLELADTARQFHSTLDPSTDDLVPLDIAERTRHAIEELRVEWPAVTVEATVPETLQARVNESFELAMTELFEQVADGHDGAATLDIRVVGEPDAVRIVVTSDQNPLSEVEQRALNAGMESDLQHTTGLGLWFVRWITTNSGGSFSINGTDSGGTVVELTFPRIVSAET